MPHHKIDNLCNRSLVFIFPSLVEEFGQISFEAMNLGLYAIVTKNTGGPDRIIDAKTDFIIHIQKKYLNKLFTSMKIGEEEVANKRKHLGLFN